MKRLQPSLAVLSLLGAAGCVSRPPTIAHVHIGHAITGVHVTPNQEGYLVTAERRGREAVEFSRIAAASNDLAVIKQNVAGAVKATDSEDDFGVKQAIVMAAITLPSPRPPMTPVSTCNKRRRIFAAHITRVVERCELIVSARQGCRSRAPRQGGSVSVAELGKLTRANVVSGDDVERATAVVGLGSVGVWSGSVAQGAGGHGRAGESSLRYRATMVSVQSRAAAERQVGVR